MCLKLLEVIFDCLAGTICWLRDCVWLETTEEAWIMKRKLTASSRARSDFVFVCWIFALNKWSCSERVYVVQQYGEDHPQTKCSSDFLRNITQQAVRVERSIRQGGAELCDTPPEVSTAWNGCLIETTCEDLQVFVEHELCFRVWFPLRTPRWSSSLWSMAYWRLHTGKRLSGFNHREIQKHVNTEH